MVYARQDILVSVMAINRRGGRKPPIADKRNHDRILLCGFRMIPREGSGRDKFRGFTASP